MKLAVLSLFVFTLHAQTDWPSFGHDADNARFSPLKQINTSNVTRLKLAWTFDTEVAAPPPARPAGAETTPAESRRPRVRRSEIVPLVIGNVLYMGTAYNRVVALEADTGKKIWEYESAHTPALRGIGYWAGTKDLPPQVVFGTGDGFLISLNAKTGKLVPSFGNEGIVNLKTGVADDFPTARLSMSSPPTIYKDLAITGSSTGEMPQRAASGDVRAWDMHTGKLAWIFHTIPRPGEPNHDAWKDGEWEGRSGVNSWGISTVDTERGLLYLPIGTPNADFYGGDRKGSNLYGSSLVCLEAATGKLKWYFQTTHHDNWDYDLTAAPTLITVKRNGASIPAVAQSTKQGYCSFSTASPASRSTAWKNARSYRRPCRVRRRRPRSRPRSSRRRFRELSSPRTKSTTSPRSMPRSAASSTRRTRCSPPSCTRHSVSRATSCSSLAL